MGMGVNGGLVADAPVNQLIIILLVFVQTCFC